ncbi:hypothetical protein P3F83_01110 [Mycobacteroides immunogenum]|uniref:hypothetical protein n=1 Tax=Mycobacteroides immunogenum TaxID=83262 RepID=UPI0025B79B3A|nr:hypothetical protein [Mycobacteroides immunogenum]WJR34084.1 hypothetical protein P3F83_01110 [Mycobacteroides immunogenum]
MPLTPGVSPVLTGTLGVIVLGAVGSWWAAALDTAVATDSAAAAGSPSSGMDGMRGRPAGLGGWCCSGA